MKKRKIDYFRGRGAEQFSYFALPKILLKDEAFKELDLQAKLIYVILLDRVSLSYKNDWLDEQGRLFISYPIQDLVDETGFGERSVLRHLKNLEDFGLIERVRRGLGRTNVIYVKDFTTALVEKDEVKTAQLTSNNKMKEITKPKSEEITPKHELTRKLLNKGYLEKDEIKEIVSFDNYFEANASPGSSYDTYDNAIRIILDEMKLSDINPKDIKKKKKYFLTSLKNLKSKGNYKTAKQAIDKDELIREVEEMMDGIREHQEVLRQDDTK